MILSAPLYADRHARPHLDFPDFASDLDAVLARAEDAGVTRIITIGTSLEGSRRAVALAEKYPQVFAVVGVHPNSAMEAPKDFIDDVARAGAGIPRSPPSARPGSITTGCRAHRRGPRTRRSPKRH